jgi:phenylacetate-CoA ligase
MGIDPKALPLRVGFLGAEPWTDELRREVEAGLDILALDIYGLSEMIGPGVSFECPEKNGEHICEDHFYPEIVDPDTGQPLPPGETGELTLTTLSKEATPLVRYRTGDLTSLDWAPCACGRTSVRMARVTGRTDDMLIVRGVNVFPSQIEAALMQIKETAPHYLIVLDRDRGTMDQLEVWVEIAPEAFSDEVKQLEALERRIAAELNSALGISVKVKLAEPKTIARSEGKVKRVVDRRELPQ